MKNGMNGFAVLVNVLNLAATFRALSRACRLPCPANRGRPAVASASSWRSLRAAAVFWGCCIVLLAASVSAPALHAQEVSTIQVGGTTYFVYEYKTVGSHVFTPPSGVTQIEYLVVGGGGGGGAWRGGGGGAGGVRQGPMSVTGPLAIVVGDGGAGAPGGTNISRGSNGGNSRLGTIESVGGGGGGIGRNDNNAGGPGGSGGGAGGANVSGAPGSGQPGQGNQGGASWNDSFSAAPRAGGGGGGADQAGGAATSGLGGNGGNGRASSITGANRSYGGGGGGASESGGAGSGGAGGGGHGNSAGNGGAGAPNTGGGGGGAGGGFTSVYSGGAGGSGVVVVRFAAPALPDCTNPEGSVSQVTVGGTTFNVRSYTQSGCRATFTPPSDVTEVEYLVVGGGGGGGGITSGNTGGAGGGGAGGFLSGPLTVTPGAEYVIVVGAGGAGAQCGTSCNAGTDGSDSLFATRIARGGGRGAFVGDNSGASGGSGGGGRLNTSGIGGAGTPGQGNAGGSGPTSGSSGAGGGGAAAAGQTATGGVGGGGGAGSPSSITGVLQFYAGGGAGGGYGGASGGEGGIGGGGPSPDVRGAGGAGQPNRGGGGAGASGSSSGDAFNGGSGGSGIVVVRYVVSDDDDDDVTPPPPDGDLPDPGAVDEGTIDISQLPLFLSSLIEPNVLFILDDSGSMLWETLPDENTFIFGGAWASRMVGHVYPQNQDQTLGSPVGVTYDDCIYRSVNTAGCDYWRSSTYLGARLHMVPRFTTNNRWAAYFRSAAQNPNYYDPAVTYRPWINPDGTEWPAANPICALHNPALPTKGCRNLTVQNTQHACWILDTAAAGVTNLCTSGNESFWPATYFEFNGGEALNPANYTRVQIAAGTPEMQNFANWYTYHRSRILASQAGIGRAFQEQGDTMRVGFGAINETGNVVDGFSTDTLIRGVRKFEGAARDEFFDLLYGHEVPLAGTPLRRALDDAGQYYMWPDNRGPWGAQPGDDDPSPHVECRLSYTILMTDGYWNQGEASTAAARLNVDNTAGPTITGPGGKSYTYTPRSPFQDSHSNTLADVAMYYWKNDLRSDLANRVPTHPINPAFWQHMVTFGVSLGLFGSIDPDDAFTAILDTDAPAINWPQPSTTGTFQNIDDLLHAGVNSRGGFFSAADPDTFARELGGTLTTIMERAKASSTALVANSVRLDAGTRVYQARFDSSDWSGEFKALVPKLVNQRLDITEVAWDAATAMPAFSARNILTHQGGEGNDLGITFAWSNFTSAQQQQWFKDDQSLFNFLRGDRSQEGGTFRTRGAVLGDMVNSDPVIVHRESFGYQRIGGAGADAYEGFVQAKKNRAPVIYVGANDGMLHGFHADTGVEVVAYIPHALLPHLKELADPAYDHRYYVDGSIHVSDAYLDGSWKTVLLGTTGAGGRVIFALDVTNPAAMTEGKVLWEFTHPKLGYTIGQPIISRLKDGTWAAIFGNGYNSDNDRAVLFILDLKTGALIGEIDTGVGDSNTPNGLGGPAGLARTESGAEYVAVVYAGDLHGNLWKFDLSSKTVVDGADRWGNLAFSGLPLFAASGPGGQAQPITVTPEIARHERGGYLVFFGTGRYFATSDPADMSVQSIYGIWDRNQTVGGRGSLQQQQILAEATVGDLLARGLSQELVDWSSKLGWYLDLVSPGGVLRGERVVVNPEIWLDRLRVVTTIPNLDDPCSPGATSWIMEMDLKTGGRLDYVVFDLDASGTFDEDDMILVDGELVAASGMRPGMSGADDGGGGGRRPLALGRTLEGVLWDPRIEPIGGRQVWRELQ